MENKNHTSNLFNDHFKLHNTVVIHSLDKKCISYRIKLSRTEVTKFFEGDYNFFRLSFFYKVYRKQVFPYNHLFSLKSQQCREKKEENIHCLYIFIFQF